MAVKDLYTKPSHILTIVGALALSIFLIVSGTIDIHFSIGSKSVNARITRIVIENQEIYVEYDDYETFMKRKGIIHKVPTKYAERFRSGEFIKVVASPATERVYLQNYIHPNLAYGILVLVGGIFFLVLIILGIRLWINLPE